MSSRPMVSIAMAHRRRWLRIDSWKREGRQMLGGEGSVQVRKLGEKCPGEAEKGGGSVPGQDFGGHGTLDARRPPLSHLEGLGKGVNSDLRSLIWQSPPSIQS
eukprot:364347-Chlamydomonas_euryale.AAC.21